MIASVDPYNPRDVFTVANETPPRVLVAPQRYVQGPGVIDHIGQYFSLLKVNRVGILASRRGLSAQGAQVVDSLRAKNIDTVSAQFNGECSLKEIESHVETLKDQKLDCLVAVGGGKLVDAGKSTAYRLDIPVVIVPTLASNDAPCSALTVLYTPEGASDSVEYFPQHPVLVVVDTDVVASADERYLVAGMGDAMATWYEARVCLNNPTARNLLGARPTLASCAMGETCAHVLYEQGEAAAESVRANRTDEVRGKRGGGKYLAERSWVSKAADWRLRMQWHLAYTQIAAVHDNYMHGEMVAMGLMAQLAMEQSDDVQRVARFFARVGLPVRLEQLSLSLQASQRTRYINRGYDGQADCPSTCQCRSPMIPCARQYSVPTIRDAE